MMMPQIKGNFRQICEWHVFGEVLMAIVRVFVAGLRKYRSSKTLVVPIIFQRERSYVWKIKDKKVKQQGRARVSLETKKILKVNSGM